MKPILFAATLAASACVAGPEPIVSPAVYSRPADYVGRIVRVCGYLRTPSNIYAAYPPDPGMAPVGLSVIDRRDVVRQTTGQRCLTGKIVRIGCTVDVICIRHTFEYGIVPRRVEAETSGATGSRDTVRPAAASAPQDCALIRGAFCVQQLGLTIDEAEASAGHSILTIYGEDWRDKALVVSEPNACRRGLADTIELIENSESDGKLLLRVRLRRDGTCDLRISANNRRTDPLGDGFFAAMTLIRACFEAPCTGPVIGRRIRSAVAWEASGN